LPKLTELPESIGKLTQLQKSNLSNNQLTELPESLGQFTQLTELNFCLKSTVPTVPCEGKVVGLADLHVEHYRPKGKVTVRTDENDQTSREVIDHPGYFWLAYEWYNLILSCPYCNTSHATEDQKEKIKHPGKLNEFRINGKRVKKAIQESRELV